MIAKHFEVLKKCTLFNSIEEQNFEHLIHCLQGYIKSYKEDEVIFSAGDEIIHVGIVLEGQIELVKENLAGDSNIVAILGLSKIFAEGIVSTIKRKSPMTVCTKEKTKVLFIPYERLIQSCGNSCGFHLQLIKNMLISLGEKNYELNNKIDFLILKGMREKLATYLLGEASKQNTLSFNIDLNRNELAEYLNVSRSSMSRELSRMKDEGIIDYYRNGFKILNPDYLKEFIS